MILMYGIQQAGVEQLLTSCCPFLCAVQIGDSLAEFLVEATPDPKLRQLMMSMAEAIRTIAHKVRIQLTDLVACQVDG